jgi:hypothetical protein
MVRAQPQPCTKAELVRGENELRNLHSWDDVYRYYKRYVHCNDAGAAEWSDECVARILVDRWNTLPRAAKLADQDAGFRHFVIFSVNATLRMKDVERIKVHGKTPVRQTLVCCVPISRSKRQRRLLKIDPIGIRKSERDTTAIYSQQVS